MKRTYLNILFILILAAGLLGACVKQDLGGKGIDTDGDEIEFSFSFTSPGMAAPSVTRSVGPADDKKISWVDVFAYRVDPVTGAETFAYHRKNISVTYTGDGKGTFSVRLARSEDTEKYSFDLIGNLGEYDRREALSQLTIGDDIATARSEIYSDGTFTMGSPTSLALQWAYVPPIEIQRDTDFGEVRFTSSLAKVDIGLNWPNDDDAVAGGLPNFKLTNLSMAGYAKTGYYLPAPENYDVTTGKVTAPTPGPSMNMSTNWALASNIQDNFVRDYCYIFEQDVNRIEYGVSFTIILRGELYDAETGALISSERYFPLRLKDPNDPSKKLDYLRGHRYRVNIIGISGEGYTSWLQAAQAESDFEITYLLTVYEEGDINHIVYSNTNYLGISTVSQLFDANGKVMDDTGALDGLDGQIKVLTDVEGGWSVRFEDENGGPVSWITPTGPTSGAADTKATVNFKVDPNDVEFQPRTAYARFEAGNLEISTMLHQFGSWYINTNYDPPNYIKGDGDEFEIYLWGAVPENVLVRAYSPEFEEYLIRKYADEGLGTPPADPPVSMFTLEFTNPGGGTVSVFSPLQDDINIIANTMVTNIIRQVQFQYSIDDGATWVPFKEGPQGKGHYTLYTTGRVVSLYNMRAANGEDLRIYWSEAMGLDPDYDDLYWYTTDMSTCYIPTHWRIFPMEPYNYPYLRIQDNYGYTPTHDTGCNAYYEESEDHEKYGKGKWRLTTRLELIEMMAMINYIGDIPTNGKYACSFEDLPFQTFANNLITGAGQLERKGQNYLVRCVLDDGDIYKP